MIFTLFMIDAIMTLSSFNEGSQGNRHGTAVTAHTVVIQTRASVAASLLTRPSLLERKSGGKRLIRYHLQSLKYLSLDIKDS